MVNKKKIKEVFLDDTGDIESVLFEGNKNKTDVDKVNEMAKEDKIKDVHDYKDSIRSDKGTGKLIDKVK